MADRKGDPAKQPPECKSVFTPSKDNPNRGTWSTCPNIKEGYSDFELTRYSCEVCGESYTLYEDDMR